MGHTAKTHEAYLPLMGGAPCLHRGGLTAARFAFIAKEIEKLPLGPLRDKYLKTIGKSIADSGPLFPKMWKEINEERIFLMHKFFHVFPVSGLTGNEKAATKLAHIDKLLDIGRRMLKDVLDMTLAQLNLTPQKLRDLLAFVTEHRKEAAISE